MTLFHTPQVTLAVQRLINEIGLQTEPSVETLDLMRIEHTARSLCMQLKALEGLDAYNMRNAITIDQQSYTAYEDLPPLRPEERDRIEQKLIRLIDPKGAKGSKEELRRGPKKPATRH